MNIFRIIIKKSQKAEKPIAIRVSREISGNFLDSQNKNKAYLKLLEKSHIKSPCDVC